MLPVTCYQTVTCYLVDSCAQDMVCVMRCVAMPQVMSRAAVIEWIMLDGLRDPPLEGGSALR